MLPLPWFASGHPPAAPADLAPQLEAVWNRHKLRDEDLRDPERLTTLLKKELAPTECRDFAQG